jgi:hypothetical protein
MNPTSAIHLVTLALLTAGMTPFCQAAIVQFTIDSALTQVTMSGTAAGLTIAEQGPGSLTTSFEGNVVAEVNDDSLRFVGGGRIEGVTNGDWSPMAFGETGTEPADFGARAGSGLISGTGALRDLLLDLESETAVPLNQGEFNADGLLFRFPEDAPSAFDYRVTVFLSTESGRELLAGYATNQITTAGTLTTQGNTQILHIPIEASIVFELLNPADSTLTITGQMRATRELEPTQGIVIESIHVEDGTLTFAWTGAPQVAVEIQGTSDLEEWTKVADVPPGTTSYSLPASPGIEFFRIFQP